MKTETKKFIALFVIFLMVASTAAFGLWNTNKKQKKVASKPILNQPELFTADINGTVIGFKPFFRIIADTNISDTQKLIIL